MAGIQDIKNNPKREAEASTGKSMKRPAASGAGVARNEKIKDRRKAIARFKVDSDKAQGRAPYKPRAGASRPAPKNRAKIKIREYYLAERKADREAYNKTRAGASRPAPAYNKKTVTPMMGRR